MKNVLKARIAPLCGIIAMIAVIGFMTGCGEDEPAAEPVKGSVRIVEGDWGAFVNYPQKAVYNPGDDGLDPDLVTYVWFKASDYNNVEKALVYDDIKDIFLAENKATYIPKDATNLIVAVYDTGEYTLAKADTGKNNAYSLQIPLISTSFPITNIDTKIEKFFGTWKMTGAHNSDWPDGEGNPTVDETIDLRYKTFLLTASIDDEFLSYKVTGWTELSGAALTVSHGDPVKGTNPANGGNTTSVTYDEGFKLAVSDGKHKNYAAGVNYTAFNVYLKGTSSGGTETYIRRTLNTGTGTTVTMIGRRYVKLADPVLE